MSSLHGGTKGGRAPTPPTSRARSTTRASPRRACRAPAPSDPWPRQMLAAPPASAMRWPGGDLCRSCVASQEDRATWAGWSEAGGMREEARQWRGGATPAAAASMSCAQRKPAAALCHHDACSSTPRQEQAHRHSGSRRGMGARSAEVQARGRHLRAGRGASDLADLVLDRLLGLLLAELVRNPLQQLVCHAPHIKQHGTGQICRVSSPKVSTRRPLLAQH